MIREGDFFSLFFKLLSEAYRPMVQIFFAFPCSRFRDSAFLRSFQTFAGLPYKRLNDVVFFMLCPFPVAWSGLLFNVLKALAFRWLYNRPIFVSKH